MMESAVESIPELANVNEIDTNGIATGGAPMTFNQYKTTFLSAATQHDERIKPPSLRGKQRMVQAAVTNYSDNGDDWYSHGYLDAGEDILIPLLTKPHKFTVVTSVGPLKGRVRAFTSPRKSGSS